MDAGLEGIAEFKWSFKTARAAISVMCCGVLLAANVVLIPLLGLLGSSLSVLLVVLFWTGASAVMLRRQMGMGADVVTAFCQTRASDAMVPSCPWVPLGFQSNQGPATAVIMKVATTTN